MLSRYLHKVTPSYISAAKYAIKYLKGTLSYGIQFTSKHNISLEEFVKFPTDPSKVLKFIDANWGPQYASVPKSTDDPTYLDLFKSRSISGYLIWRIIAHSTVEAEVYATNECTKRLTHLQNILRDLNITKFSPRSLSIYTMIMKQQSNGLVIKLQKVFDTYKCERTL